MQNDFASQTVMSSDGVQVIPVTEQQKLVSIVIEYPEDFAKTKHFANGHVEHNMDEGSAKVLIDSGIAKLYVAPEVIEGEGAKVTEAKYSNLSKKELQEELGKRSLPYLATDNKTILTGLLTESDSV